VFSLASGLKGLRSALELDYLRVAKISSLFFFNFLTKTINIINKRAEKKNLCGGRGPYQGPLVSATNCMGCAILGSW